MAALLVSSTVYEVLMIHRNRKRNDFLVAFSLYRNGKKLFEMRNETSPNVIKCLSGLRTFAMLHIMFGHRYLQWFASPNINPRAFALGSSWSQSFMGSLVHMHPIAVDTFFVMGGLLLAKSILSAIEKKRFNIPRMYLHRYIRTMPVLAFLILYTVSLLKFAGEGPIFVSRSRNAMIDTCKENYWATLLYIHNYYNPVGSCMEVSWYLAADFQLVLVSPLIVYPIYKWGWKVLWVLPAYIAGTVIWVFVVAYAEEFLAYTQLMPFTKIVDYYETLYGTALIRCAPWMVGIIVGYYLHKLKGRKIQINKFLNAALWIAAISVLLAITLGSAAFRRPADENSIFANALFLALERQSWGLAIAWIIFGCEMGGGGPVRKFLELPCWQPLGRMSLSFYLVHIFVSFVHLSSIKTPLYFSDLNVWTHLCADFLTSAAAAAILYLTFEEPVLHIESSVYKWIATRKSGRDSEAKA